MSREDPQLKLRLTPELKDRVVEAARANKRSVNAEIVSRLEDSLDADHNLVGLQIYLNTDGMPISWDEISEHLRAISRAGRLNVQSQTVHVITPQLLSSQGREEEADRLAKSYRQAEAKSKKASKEPESTASKRQVDVGTPISEREEPAPQPFEPKKTKRKLDL